MTEQQSPTFPQQGGLGAHLLAFFAGIASGLAFVQLFGGGTLGVLIAYLAPLPIFLAALAGGRAPAITATLFALVAILLRTSSPLQVELYAAIIGVPSMVLARVALLNYAAPDTAPRFTGAGVILLTALALGTLLTLGASAMLTLEGHGIADAMTHVVANYKSMLAEANPDLPADQIEASLNALKSMLPSMIMIGWLCILLVNYIIAQNVAGEIGQRQRPQLAIRDITLPVWLVVMFALCIIVSMFTTPDIAMTLSALAGLYAAGFLLSGLGVMHRALDRLALAKGWSAGKLKAVYIFAYFAIFVLFIPQFFLLLAGLIAPFTGLRHHSRTVVADMSATESKE